MSHTTKDFLIGAAIGGILGTTAALMAAPKSGKKIREDICDAYCDISDKTHDAIDNVTKKSKCFIKKMNSNASDLSGKTKNFMDNITEWISHEQDEAEEFNARDLLIGSIAGVVLGATAGLLLAPKSGPELRNEINEAYDNLADKTHDMVNQFSKKEKVAAKKIKTSANKWLSIAQNLVEHITENAQDTGEEVIEKGKEWLDSKNVKDAMDWASLGLRIMQHIKKRG